MRGSFNPLVWPSALARQLEERQPACGLPSCSRSRSTWRRLWRRSEGMLLQGVYYCQPECVETALVSQLAQLERLTPSEPPISRMPLGLLMMARGRLTHNEVLAALDAQRRAQHGTIGDWLETLGFATEDEVTSALGLQWGCPVATSLQPNDIPPFAQIPHAILEAFRMLPVQYAATTQTLYLACARRLDHATLYVIEQVLGCRTQPCVGSRKIIAVQLDKMRRQGAASEVQFGPVRDIAEMTRIGFSYLTRLSASETRLGRVGSMIWLRLKAHTSYMNVLFHLMVDSAGASPAILTPPSRSAGVLPLEETGLISSSGAQ